MNPINFFKYIGLVVLTISLNQAICQSTNKNFVKTVEPQVAVKTETSLNSLSVTLKTSNVTYFDGLLRPTQMTGLAQASSSRDLITNVETDPYGNVLKSYQPYTLFSNSGNFDPNSVDNVDDFYTTASRIKHTDYYYSETVYENSPLFRVLEQSAPGESWTMGANHTITYDYLLNSASEVHLWAQTSTNCSSSAYYAANSLKKDIIIDEHGVKTITYKDKIGHVIKKQVTYIEQVESEGQQQQEIQRKHETYYVYDDFGNLAWVIPPKAVKLMYDNNNLSVNYLVNTLGEDLCFHYTYDERQRLIKEKTPGAEEEFLLYNKLNQVVLSQTGNQRADNQWTYFKYDALGRKIVSGLYTNGSYSACSTSVYGISEFFEKRTSTNYSTQFGYTNNVFPTSSTQILTVNYFDDYDFNYNGTSDVSYTTPSESYYSSSATKRTTGLLTGSKQKVLGSNNYITSYQFYNERAEVIQYFHDLLPSGNSLVNTAYTFSGLPEHNTTYHNFNSVTTELHYRYTYNNRNQLVNSFLNVNNSGEKNIARNEYNLLGQLIEKNLGKAGSANGSNPDNQYLQSIDFAYNERGWLNYINNCELSNNLPAGWGNGAGGFNPNEVVDRLTLTFAVNDIGNGPFTELTIVDEKLHVENIEQYDPNFPYEVVSSNTNSYSVVTAIEDPALFDVFIGINGQSMLLDFYAIHAEDTITDSIILAHALSLTNSALGSKGVTNIDAIETSEELVSAYISDEIYTDVFNDDDTDLWGMCFDYDQSHSDLLSDAQYNGNIASLRWMSKTNSLKKGYGFQYDGVNRLTDATYKAYDGINATWTNEVNRYTVNDISYDYNGNITALSRQGLTDFNFGTFGMVDNLTYTYSGNLLKAVADAAGHTYNDFHNGASATIEYSYDNSGNMTADDNKDIDVTYNHLNLVHNVSSPNSNSNGGGNGNSLAFTYDATGRKLAKAHYLDANPGQNTPVIWTYYMDEFQYTESTNGITLDFITMPDGRLVPDGNGGFEYEYHIKDHLGNLRLAFSDLNQNKTITSNDEIIQEANYYPFGMEHKYADGSQPPLVGEEHQYKFNGKELQTEFGLDWADFGARMYDAQLGRWHGVDPLAHEFPSYSPYNYCLNNPIRLVDPDGAAPGDPIGPGYYQANVNSRMVGFSVRHPIAAASIGLPTRGSTNISTNSVRFSTRIGLNENAAHEGSQVNAFRHVLWQSEITAQFGSSIAKQVGNLHEENPFAANGSNFKTSFSTSAAADQTIDLMNNVIGRAIGEATKGESMQFRALVTLEYNMQNGLWTSTPTTDKNGKVTGYTISQTKLSQDQYNAAKQTIIGLNEDGFTPTEQSTRDAAAQEAAKARAEAMKGPKF